MLLRFLANLNSSPETVKSLRGEGWDIIRVSDLLPVNASDQNILELARKEDKVIVTQDLDFSALLALGGYSKPSVVTLRLTRSDPGTVSKRLSEIVPGKEKELRQGCAITIDDYSVRVRRLPIE
jgi:predicted nuclease of predicted toxin-antitoxin system